VTTESDIDERMAKTTAALTRVGAVEIDIDERMAKTTAALNRVGAVESDIDERMPKTTAALNRVGASVHCKPTRDTAPQPERDADNTNERRTMAPTSFKIEIENYRTRARDPRAPPPQGGCPSISSRPSTESESENRKSSCEKFSSSSPPSPSIAQQHQIAILLLGIASEIASEWAPIRICFAESSPPTFLSSS
jgi:hypothetical protein